jgi:DNA primase
VTPTTLWLADHLRTLSLSEEAEGYLYGRAATAEAIQHFRFVEWVPSKEPSPSTAFSERYGRHGEKLAGLLAYPLLSPRGGLIGFEARSMQGGKRISEFRTPEAEWNPVMINAPEAARKLWDGGSAWVVEGMFDLLPLRMVAPETDVVIGTLRAGLSQSHVEFLARFCRNRVYMVYDNDETGRKATLGWVDKAGKPQRGAIERLSRAGLRAIDFRYRGKDPGEVWSSGGMRNLVRAFK